MENNHDKQIIAKILEGEKQAYAEIVERYKTVIYNLAYRMTGDENDAAELTQDTFVQAYFNLWRYNPKRKFFTWLYTISINIIRNHLKKNSKYKQTEEISQNENQYFAEINLPQTHEINICLSKLDVETRALILMKYQEEFSFDEMAQITGKNVSALKMRVYRGLEKLKMMLTK